MTMQHLKWEPHVVLAQLATKEMGKSALVITIHIRISPVRGDWSLYLYSCSYYIDIAFESRRSSTSQIRAELFNILFSCEIFQILMNAAATLPTSVGRCVLIQMAAMCVVAGQDIVRWLEAQTSVKVSNFHSSSPPPPPPHTHTHTYTHTHFPPSL